MKDWYQKQIEEVFQILKTNQEGLSEKEVKNRLLENGLNLLPKKKSEGFFHIFFRGMLDPIVLLLVVTVIFSFLVGEFIDGIAIILIIMLDLFLGTIQEYHAEKTADSLSDFIKVNSLVQRKEGVISIDSKNLVVGDIVLLSSGDRVAADLRIISSQNLQVNESILTGESTFVLKDNKVLEKETPFVYRTNMLYSGTSIAMGRATAVVVATGLNTEIGKIADTVSETKRTSSPLTIRMNQFSKQIGIFILIIAIVIAAVLFWKGVSGKEIFLSVIALSVSAMPEGLPLALTMALTIASNRMAKKNVIVKKLNSVESLGSCTVIASDKTGTLTMNEQMARKILLPNDIVFEITGYSESGEVVRTTSHIPSFEKAYEVCKLGVINNEATQDQNGKWYGDSIDIAFLVLGKKINVDTSRIKIQKRIPYESENQYSAVFYEEEGKIHVTVKGSFEKVLGFCSKMNTDSIISLEKEFLRKQNEHLAIDGYRVIALAEGIVSKKELEETKIKNLIFQGMVAFIDPIREDVKASIQECRNAGIKVVMITGDHPFTAFAIGKELGLASKKEEVATGEEIEKELAKGLASFDSFIASKSIFTRVTPLDKLEIVSSFQRQQEFVAVTGDGVNDAPALKNANIGVSMGSGTDVAKETATMILQNDNFTSIVAGIQEGRTAYSNIRKVSYMLLSCGVAEVLFFLLSVICNLPIPLVAIQLLWLNIVTDGLQDIALSFEKSGTEIMTEKPRSTKETIFNQELFWEVIIAGVTIGMVVFLLWKYLIGIGMDVRKARGYVMALMVFMQNIHVFNCRSERESIFHIPFFSNPFILITIFSSILLQIIVMEVPIFSTFLQVTAIPYFHLFYLFLLSLFILSVMEVFKICKRRLYKN